MIINSKCIKINAVCSFNLLKLFRLLPQMDPGETSQNAPSLIQTFSFNIRESFVRSPSFSILPLFGMSGLASELGVTISTWTRILVSTLSPLTIFFIYCAEICWPKFFFRAPPFSMPPLFRKSGLAFWTQLLFYLVHPIDVLIILYVDCNKMYLIFITGARGMELSPPVFNFMFTYLLRFDTCEQLLT